MARTDHPERTVLLGALLIVAAMLAGLAVRVWTHPPRAVWIPVLVVALIAALVGVAMTMRDLTPPRR
ncbi:hypothetical protein [Jatrophihabitans endophyticus]|uniref:hypothetical protein n=1 Tax=Jatrophihabitans endophyticus TaxID=1206085 RepID=UPI0019D87D16|nr:hypothetical protein [Jatrophihabitans endophyticus]MBE7188095.1 hypothetical protein [Jatrophihabitans endophyticus]